VSSIRYKELDSLRGFAAIFVMLFHFSYHTVHESGILNLGVTGVDLFFIISGFVIFMSINSVSSSREFIVNRFARLFPTYWTCVLFTTIAILIFGFVKDPLTITPYMFFSNMTMFQHYLRAENIDGTYWTMIIEMVFYIFILLLYRLKLLKHILAVGLPLIAICLVWDIFIEDRFIGLYKLIRYVFPLIAHFPLFMAGIIFYRIIKSEKFHWLDHALLPLCLVAQVVLFQNGGSAHNYISQLNYGIMLAIYFVIFTLFVHQKFGFIVNKPFLFMGKISYALYLIHQYLTVDLIIPRLELAGVNYYVSCIIAFVAAVTLAYLITFYIEIPIGKKIRMKLNK
jgi:peptidoglycan/LPS O-acetylase OafA/YrhL